jgi:molybdenum cofactor biosynthesis enzyme MoaA
MLNELELKVLHLEPTDVCQAACPACARETNSSFDKNKQHHLTVDQILSIVTVNDIKNLDKMFMCGNYGDPAAGKYTMDIYRYFRSVNPGITLGMNTNGAIRSTAWWHDIGQLFSNTYDYVVFSIDGLYDTNHLYRVNVEWNKLIENAQAFIAAGGSAHWDMLVYKHNQHQVDLASDLAKKLGFKWFRAKVSKRPLIKNLQYPTNWNRDNAICRTIDCHAVKEKSIFIDAQGRKNPCCWIGGSRFNFIKNISEVESTWTSSSPNLICQQTCGQLHNKTNFENQWRIEKQLY